MRKMMKVLVPVFMLALVVAGCSKGPVEPQTNMPLTASYALPIDAALESATLHIYVVGATNHPVTAHRVTAAWDEMTVTWNSFGAAFDAAVVDGFMTDAGWQTTDVTSLVQAWMNGTYANYGILLDEADDQTPRSIYASSESADFPTEDPWIEFCYTIGADPTVYCDTIVITEDTYISEYDPNTNFGENILLFTGRPYLDGTPVEKQTLLYFELEVTPPPLCAIGDFVWYDDNMNGIQDAGEMGVPGVTVQLMDCEGNVLDEMLTDANGYYLFDELQPGHYNIHFVLPAGYVWTLQDQGADDAVDSDVDANGTTICTELVAGEIDRTWDAGIYMPEQEGCTRTPGYWKNWSGFGPQPDMVTQYLPIWLGTPMGAKSIHVTNAQTAVELLGRTWGSSSNGILKLYCHLLAAKLNVAAGASADDLGTAIADADAFLAMYNWMDWDSLSKANKNMVNRWVGLLDDYNNGCIGPGHCDNDPYAAPCD